MNDATKQRDRDGYEIAPAHKFFTNETVEQIDNEFSHFEPSNELVWVKSNYHSYSDGGDPVAVREKNPLHPTGEVFVAGAKPVQVALTPRIASALSEKKIILASHVEADAYEAERLEDRQRSLAAKKEEFRAKYIALTGSEAGFEAAWEGRNSNESLQAVLARL